MTPKALVALLRAVPPRLRQYVYLALALVGVALLVYSWVQQGLSLDQIGYAVIALVGSMAGANVTPPRNPG